MIYCNQDPQSPPTIFYLPSPPPTLYPYSSNWAIIYGYLQSAPAPVMMKVRSIKCQTPHVPDKTGAGWWEYLYLEIEEKSE